MAMQMRIPQKDVSVCLYVRHPSNQTMEQFRRIHVNILCCIECGDKINGIEQNEATFTNTHKNTALVLI